MPALEVAGLTKHYGTVRALHDVSFSVDAGEIFGYLGPNGAGKTTTLRVLAGLVRADAGMAQLLGEPAGHAATRERLGYLPGELRLYGSMTAGALLERFARFRPRRPPVLRQRLLDAFGLSSSDLARRVKFLSHGTKQKLGLVIAMQHDPELLLLDEPTNGLDPLVQREFRAVLRERAAAGRAVLLSSHVLSEVEATCNRVAVLHAGQMLAQESVETLRARIVRRLQLRARAVLPTTLARTPGVARAEIDGRDAVLWVQGDLNPVLRAVAELEVERFVFSEPQLEDVFIGFFTEVES